MTNKSRNFIGWLALGVLGLILLGSLANLARNFLDRAREATHSSAINEAFSIAAGYANIDLATYQPEPILNPGCEHRPEWYEIGVEDLGNGRYKVEGRVVTGNVYCVKDESYFTATVYHDEDWHLSGEVSFTNSCVLHETYQNIPDDCFFSKLNQQPDLSSTSTAAVSQLQKSDDSPSSEGIATPSPKYTATSSPLPVDEDILIGEIGQIVNGLSHEPLIVTLQNHFSNPIVIAQPPSYEEADEAVVRISDVENDSFTMFIQEAPNRDGVHERETVSYLVLEAGCWELPGGSLIQAGSTMTDATVGRNILNHWEYVSYGLPFTEVPIIFSQVQTINDPNYVKTKYYERTPIGYQLALEEEEASTTPHQEERIGWVAIEPQDLSWNGIFLRVSRTPLIVGDDWYHIAFGSLFNDPPLFLASTQSYNGKDNSLLRFINPSPAGIYIKIEEDTTFDNEMMHETKDIIGYMAISDPGSLKAQQNLCFE